MSNIPLLAKTKAPCSAVSLRQLRYLFVLSQHLPHEIFSALSAVVHTSRNNNTETLFTVN